MLDSIDCKLLARVVTVVWLLAWDVAYCVLFQLCKAEQLAVDLELFARHAGRKSVNMEDVVLSSESSFIKMLSPAHLS